MNKMKDIKVEKITLKVGAGKEQAVLKKGLKLIKNLTGKDPVQTVTKKRIPSWGLRPGLPVGCMLTLRGKEATDLLRRLFHSKSNTLKPTQFDNGGSFGFGIPEYIDILGAKYDPEIGMMGLEVYVTLVRPGFRIRKKRIRPSPVGKKHRITKEEAIEFIKKEFNVKIGDES